MHSASLVGRSRADRVLDSCLNKLPTNQFFSGASEFSEVRDDKKHESSENLGKDIFSVLKRLVPLLKFPKTCSSALHLMLTALDEPLQTECHSIVIDVILNIISWDNKIVSRNWSSLTVLYEKVAKIDFTTTDHPQVKNIREWLSREVFPLVSLRAKLLSDDPHVFRKAVEQVEQLSKNYAQSRSTSISSSNLDVGPSKLSQAAADSVLGEEGIDRDLEVLLMCFETIFQRFDVNSWCANIVETFFDTLYVSRKHRALGEKGETLLKQWQSSIKAQGSSQQQQKHKSNFDGLGDFSKISSSDFRVTQVTLSNVNDNWAKRHKQ
eukprot:GDKJ01016891.1.p1 GENE.GDKJ01016891.1~~GDKJ01016891.1.p1  ORF type:complete len:323 (-),score=60.35 GDKJ01016891.1:45-1013(-)